MQGWSRNMGSETYQIINCMTCPFRGKSGFWCNVYRRVIEVNIVTGYKKPGYCKAISMSIKTKVEKDNG